MRKTSLAICILLVTGILLYLFIFGWLIPKTATLSLPYKWRTIPVKQSKFIARSYLGDSFSNDSTTTTGKEVWSAGSKGRLYLLRLDYTDSVVTGYSIRYAFSNAVISRNYLLDTFSVK